MAVSFQPDEGQLRRTALHGNYSTAELSPGGLVICHSCDNKLCVNPDHLRAETQAFNIREAIERGRWKPNIGTANGRALLTPSQVEQMRISDGTQEMLAASFGISQSQVSRIIRGESWKKSAA